ncbi:MAG: hypothetical protein AAF944_29120 [Bacteroidota bacterium]
MELSFIINNPIESPQAEADKAKREANITGGLVEDEYGDEVYIISKISDSLLKIILQYYDNILASEDHILPLEGGLWLEHEGESIYPQCCGELNDYSNWQEMMENPFETWHILWIGHPCVYYCMKDDLLYLSDYQEPDNFPEEENIKFTFQRQLFLDQLSTGLKEIEIFKQRISRIVDEENFRHKEVLKSSLII